MDRSSMGSILNGFVAAIAVVTPALASNPGAAIYFPPIIPANPTPLIISGDGTTAIGVNGVPNRGFQWKLGHGITVLPRLPATDTTNSVSAINTDGSVIAGYSRIGTSRIGTRWIDVDIVHAIDDLPGGDVRLEPKGISGDGNIVVGIDQNSLTSHEAFVWTKATGTFGLGHLSSSHSYSSADAISADGSTVVGVSSGSFSRRAFKWTAADGMVSLGVDAERATGVNSDGSAIVGSMGGGDAFLWTSDQGIQELSHPWDSPSSVVFVSDVSDNGVIVGNGRQNGSSPNVAVLWSEDRGSRLFADMLAEDYGFAMEDFTYSRLTSVSDDGRVFAGVGHFGSEPDLGFVVIIPSPTPVFVAMCSLGAVCARRRRAN